MLLLLLLLLLLSLLRLPDYQLMMKSRKRD